MKRIETKKIVAIVLVIVIVISVIISGIFAGLELSGASRISWIKSTIKKYYYYDVSDDDLNYAIENNDLSLVLDKYSSYYTKEGYTTKINSNNGKKQGLGFSYTYRPSQYGNLENYGILVSRVYGNSPAYFAGLKNGTYLKYAYVGENKIALDSSSSLDYAVSLMEDSYITLEDIEGNKYNIESKNYTASYASMITKNCTYNFEMQGNNNYFSLMQYDTESVLDDKTAVIQVKQFYGTVAEEVGVLIQLYNSLNLQNLVIDLRGNGGGYVEAMQYMSYYFIGNIENYNTLAMKAVDKYGNAEDFNVLESTTGNTPLKLDTNLYVLADLNTASASEALIGVLLCSGLLKKENVLLSNFSNTYVEYTGTQKNGKSYGKGIMQSTYERSTGEALTLTTAKIYWPDTTTCIHDIGISESMGCRTFEEDWVYEYKLSNAMALISSDSL